MHGWARAMCAGLIALLAPLARGETPPVMRLPAPPSAGGVGDVILEEATLGWEGYTGVDRHVPLRMVISSGARAFAGEVEVRYSANASHSVRLVTSVSTTPGRSTRVDVPVCFPQIGGSVEITLREGRRSVSATVERMWNAASQPVRLFVAPLTPRVLDAGDPQALQWAFGERADALPTAWISYESVSLLVAREETLLAAQPAVRDAVRGWVEAGGHLLLIVDQAGSRWAELAPADASGAVRLLDQMPVPAPLGVARSELSPEVLAQDDGSLLPTGQDLWTVRARVLEVTPEGAARGWRIDPLFAVRSERREGSTEVPTKVPTEAPPRGLVASGSAGLGRVTLLGGDPETFPRTLDARRTSEVWSLVLRSPGQQSLQASQAMWTSTWSTGNSYAVAEAVDPLLRVPHLRLWVLVVFASLVVLVAAMVGPVGQAMLKRRRRASDGWKLGLGGAMLATLVALAVPRLTRDHRADGVLVRLFDAELDASGGLIAGPAEMRLAAFVTGAPRDLPLGAIAPTADGAWWRPLSTSAGWPQETPGPPLVLRAGLGEAGRLRDSEPMGMRLGQASLGIASMDAPRPLDRADAPVPRVRVERLSDDGLALRMEGLPAGVLVQAHVHANQKVWRGSGTTDERGGLVLESGSATSSLELLSSWAVTSPVEQVGVLGMAGVRTHHMEERSRGFETARVGLLIEEPDAAVTGESSQNADEPDRIASPRKVTGWRVLVPVRDRRAEAPAALGEES